MLFINKQKKVESSLAEYREKVSTCLEVFENSILQYLETSDKSMLEKNCVEIHKAESLADDIRREIEVMMYSKSLFPESRGDILILLETMDRVPNQAEATVHMISNQQIQIPKQFHNQIIELVNICVRCTATMLESSAKLFTDFTSATMMLGKVDELESEADHLEEAIIKQIFSSKLDGFQKIMLRDTVKQISTVCDRAEKAGDRIQIIVAKRRI
jgi:predicted phosphate transport protein (TIGR00153 family)